MSLDTRPPRAVRIVRNRDLMLLLGAGLISQTGDWVLATGVGFQVYALTGSALASAAILIATQVPQAVLGSAAGVLIDRWDRRRTMVAANALLALLLLPLTAVHRADQVGIVVAVVALSSCVAPFFLAAEASLTPAVVEDGLRVTANALNGQLRNVARLIGAAIGGVLVAVGGFVALATVDLVSFLLAGVLVTAVRHRVAPAPRRAPHLLNDWTQGLTTIRRSRALVVVLLFFAVSGIGEAVMGTLFAPFVHDVLHGTGAEFGAILSAQAIGGIAGGLVVTAAGHRVDPRLLFGGGAVLFGVLDTVLFLYPLIAPVPWPGAVIIALVGLPGAALSAGMLTLFQHHTRDTVRGRVFGTLITAQNTTMLLGSGLAGGLADAIGVLPVIVVQGLLYTAAGGAVLGLLRPRGSRTAVPA